MKDFKERLKDEIKELELRIKKLGDFIETSDFDKIIKNGTQRKLLVIQLSQMNSLLNILKLRLEIIQKEN